MGTSTNTDYHLRAAADPNLFLTSLQNIKEPCNKVDFFAKHVSQEDWVSQNPKFCKKSVKMLLSQHSEGSPKELDKVIAKVLSTLSGPTFHKFHEKIFHQALAVDFFQSCLAIVREGILDRQLACEDSETAKILLFAAQTNSIDPLIWLKSNLPDSLKKIVDRENEHFQIAMKTAVSNGTTKVLDWFLTEDSSLVSLFTKPVECTSLNFLQLAAGKGQLTVLKWFADKYLEQFNTFFNSLDGFFFLPHVAYSGSLEIFLWFDQNFHKRTKEILSVPDRGEMIAFRALPFFPLFQWLDTHYPEAIRQMLERSKEIDEAAMLFFNVASSDNLEALKLIRQRYPKHFQDLLNNELEQEIENVLHSAAAAGATSILQWLKEIDSPLFEKLLRKKTHREEYPFHFSLIDGSRKALEWFLFNYPALSEDWLKGFGFASYYFLNQLTTNHIKLICQYLEDYVHSIHDLLIEKFKTLTLQEIAEFFNQTPFKQIEKRDLLHFRITLAWVAKHLEHTPVKALTVLKPFFQIPQLPLEECSWAIGNILHLAAEADDCEALAFLHQHYPSFFSTQLTRQHEVTGAYFIHYVVLKGARSCCDWLCRACPEYVQTELDIRLIECTYEFPRSNVNLVVHQTALDLAFYHEAINRKELLEVFNNYFPSLIDLQRIVCNLIQECASNKYPRDLIELTNCTKLLDAILIHPCFNALYLAKLKKINPQITSLLMKRLNNNLIFVANFNTEFISYLIREKLIFITATELRRIVANLNEDQLVLLLKYAAEKAKAYKDALELVKLLPRSFIVEQFEIIFSIDLFFLVQCLQKMNRKEQPQQIFILKEQLDRRLKEIFAPENHAYLKHILPRLLANPNIAQYLLSTRSVKVAEVISLHELPPDVQLQLLPLFRLQRSTA